MKHVETRYGVRLLAAFLGIAAGLFLFFPMSASAFKIDTHVWVAQQVLNDVIPDGKITIEPFGEYTVDFDTVNVLRNYQSEYRMGNIGPDGLPDMLAGQMAVHPGVVGGWQTDNWLKWVWTNSTGNDRNKAFAYGYMSHAAADVFSHTYVNNYAGDVFLLTDGEQTAELRHFALEQYIVSRTPRITDYMGNSLGSLSNLVSAPSEFLSNSLILNGTVADQYDLTPSGVTLHLKGMYKVKAALDRAVGKADDVTSLISSGLSSLNSSISEYENKMQELDDEIDAHLNDIIYNEDVIEAQNAIIDTSVYLVAYWTGEVSRLQSEINDLNDDIDDLQDQLANTVKETCHESCKYCPPGDPFCDEVCNTVCDLTSEWIDLSNRLDQKLRDLTTKEADRLTAMQNQIANEAAIIVAEEAKALAQAAIETAQAAITAAQELKDSTNALLIQARTDLANLLERSIEMDPIRAALANWRDDIVRAVEAYAAANSEVMREMLKADGEPLQPLEDWLNCWAPVFGAVPSVIPQAECLVTRTVDDLVQQLEDLRNRLGNLVWLIDPVGQLKDIIEAEVREELEDEVIELTAKVAGPDMANLAALIVNGISEDRLNSIYSTNETDKGLLVINDIASRVNAEMHLTAEGHFDPLQYRVVRNSVTFAKLVLLGADQLNSLAAAAGVTGGTRYGSLLYADKENFNIVFDVIKSIDGNQQWQDPAMPYPRMNGQYLVGPDNPISYGYSPFDISDYGLRIWWDPTARKQLFNVIFQGPLAPGIEYPVEFGLNDIIGEDYPYRACKQNPFPRTRDDNGEHMMDATGAYRDPGCDEDLVVSSVAWKSPGHGDKVILFEAVVENQGAHSAPTSEMALYLSSDDQITTSDIYLGKHQLQKLEPGEKRDARGAFRIPTTASAGYYYVGAIIDGDRQVNESNENNNTIIGTPSVLELQ